MRLRTHTRVWQTAGGAAWLLAFGMGLAGCEKWRLDAEVDALCAKDSGIRTHRVVVLDANEFESSGLPKFYRLQAWEIDQRLGSSYLFQAERTELKEGNPSMWRSRYKIIDRGSKELLGELTVYGRRGGDFPGPWAESHILCPNDVRDIDLVKAVFRVRGD